MEKKEQIKKILKRYSEQEILERYKSNILAYNSLTKEAIVKSCDNKRYHIDLKKKELVRGLSLDCVKTLATGWLLMELNEMDN